MTQHRVGFFGGSFNPPHLGHVAAARRAVEALGLWGLVVMPAGTPPHKALPPGTPLPEDRLAMCGLAFADLPGCVVSELEMRPRGPVYTTDTLELLRSDDTQHILVVGSDMFLTLHEWYRAEEIFAAARVAVLVRAGGQENLIREQAAFLAHRYGAAVDWIPHEPVEISSTELRAMLGENRGWEYLPGKVGDYIKEKGLYGAK